MSVAGEKGREVRLICSLTPPSPTRPMLLVAEHVVGEGECHQRMAHLATSLETLSI